MILDSSAIIAMLLEEPEAQAIEDLISQTPSVEISAAAYVESGIVLDARRDPVLSRGLDQLLSDANVAIAPVTAEQALVARQAYRDFGKGSGHPAQLNFGDCFTYALAKLRDDELLYKGDDFSHTDVRGALPTPL